MDFIFDGASPSGPCEQVVYPRVRRIGSPSLLPGIGFLAGGFSILFENFGTGQSVYPPRSP